LLDLDSFRKSVFEVGFAIAPGVLAADEADKIVSELSASELNRSRAGARHVLKYPCVNKIAEDRRVLALAQAVLGERAFPFRATLFDKSPDSNWLVVWHQDKSLPLSERRETPGWGPWTVKASVNYAHAPAQVLEQILALRIHLDDSTETNGPLRVVPGTHKRGVLTDRDLHALVSESDSATCLVSKGGIIAMRPLIMHASSKSQSDEYRRVLHIEYTVEPKFENQLRLAVY
jgi:ectoine hydroxylase-related dioxygenase (phytanoyl-CoA dioxygenase family)